LNRLIKIFLTIVFLLGVVLTFRASLTVSDSLKKQLDETHNASKRIEVLVQLAKHYLKSEPDSSIFYAQEALNLSKKSAYQNKLGDIYGLLGDVYVMNDRLSLAEKYYDSCLFFLERDKNISGVAGVLTVLGNINVVLDNTSEALQYYLRALKISSDNKILNRLPYLHLNIGTIQFSANNIIEAQNYYTKALDGFEAVNDSINIARVLSSIGSTYSELNNFELANDYYKKALAIFQKLNSAADIAGMYYNMAILEKKQDLFTEALKYLELSKKNIKEIDYTYAGPRLNISSQVEVELGENYLLLNKLKKAKPHLLKGYTIASENKFLFDTRNASMNLSRLYEQMGIHDSALYFHKIYQEVAEKLINVENIKKLATIEARLKYEQLEKDQELALLAEKENQNRKTRIFVVVIIILILLAAVLMLFLKLGRNRVKRIKLEQTTLQKELEIRNKELTTNVLYQLKKNELILNIIQKLSQSVSKLEPENKKVIEEIIRQLETDSGDEVWKEFEVRFQQVHIDFYKSLTKQFPDLSSNELRLCAFLRLNMNTKDISAITYQSVNSIDVARSRLRNKFNLSKEESLTAFLSRF
jgi:tetratricopeptide (TPR) repeat protein